MQAPGNGTPNRLVEQGRRLMRPGSVHRQIGYVRRRVAARQATARQATARQGTARQGTPGNGRQVGRWVNLRRAAEQPGAARWDNLD
jgi:hypothetical protein